jgi:hypothetical protein
MLDIALLKDFVIDREYGPARITENAFDTMVNEGSNNHGRTGHLIGILALGLTHGRLRIRAGFVSASVANNKKGP